MTALPTTPGFITCHAVYLLKNHFIKEESMTTKKYLSYFFLFDKIDFVKKGISRHLAKIFESGELDEEMIVAKIAITTQHGAMQDKTAFGKDYFRELLERVRSIRASERRIQQQIYLPGAALIMIEIPIPHIIFMPPYRINSTMPLPVKQRLKSSIIKLTTTRKIWA